MDDTQRSERAGRNALRVAWECEFLAVVLAAISGILILRDALLGVTQKLIVDRMQRKGAVSRSQSFSRI